MPARFKLLFGVILIVAITTIAVVNVWMLIDLKASRDSGMSQQSSVSSMTMQEAASHCRNNKGGSTHSGGNPMVTVCFTHDLSTGDTKNFDAVKAEFYHFRQSYGAEWHEQLSAAVSYSCQMSNPVAFDVARAHYRLHWRADSAQKWPELFIFAHDEHCMTMRPVT